MMKTEKEKLSCPFTGNICSGRECMLWNDRLGDCVLQKIGISAVQTAINTFEMRRSLDASKKRTEDSST
jgi:hypothetical protein